MSFLNVVNKPYPYIGTFGKRILVSLFFGLYVFLFLVVFQPFGVFLVSEKKILYLLGFGVITFSVVLFNFLVLSILSRLFFDLKKWRVKNEIIIILWNILMISVINHRYDSIMSFNLSYEKDIFFFFKTTFLVGLFPIVVYLLTRKIFLKKSSKKVENLSNVEIFETKEVFMRKNQPLLFRTDCKRESFKIQLSQLLFIKSEGNYSLITYTSEDRIMTKLLRVSLKSLEKQLSPFESLVRLHRSYIVNKRNVSNVSGNSRRYSVYFKQHNKPIPVSRNFSKKQLFMLSESGSI